MSVPTLLISGLLQAMAKCIDNFDVRSGGALMEEADHRHRDLLRARYKRPPRRRAPEHRDNLAAVHSITSSAMASKLGVSVTPSALAVLRLMSNSKVVGCSIGRALGLVPLRMRSTKNAARRDRSAIRAEYDIKPPASTFWRKAKIVG